jgi:hypothetical protein
MDLVKQYIVQCISSASNNLRLSTQKIEVVALLRENIAKSDDLEQDFKNMKKITELSTLAIRLNEIYNFLIKDQVDILKLSDKFKEHSQILIKDVSHMLDVVSPATFKEVLNKLNGIEISIAVPEREERLQTEGSNESFDIDLSKRKSSENIFEKSESEQIKEKIIMEEDKDDEEAFFQNYEAEIIKPIKQIDVMLKSLANNEFDLEEITNFAELMKKNAELSTKVGFDIIAGMHRIVAKALLLIRSRELMPGRDVVEAMRACLIVIVAVVKGKEVDITNYLNRAEEFGRKIQTLKIKDFS